MFTDNNWELRFWTIITFCAISIVWLFLFFSSWFTVSPWERAFVVTFWQIWNDVYDSWFHFKNPLADTVKVNVQTKKIEASASAASKDLQNVSAKVAVNYNIIPSAVRDIKKNYWDEDTVELRLIQPSIQDSIKSSTAQFTAEELVTKRPQVSELIFNNLKDKVNKQWIQISSINIMDFNFSESFNQAIEAKVTAQQEAEKAKNNLARIKYEWEQAIVTAEAQAKARVAQATAEAEAVRITTQAIENNWWANYVQLKAIEKWNWALPTQMLPNQTVPFLNIWK